MAIPEKPSPNAGRVHLQWNEGWETWQEVSPQYAGEPGVVTFIRATTHQRTLEALREAEEEVVALRNTLRDRDHELATAALTRIKGDGK